MRRMASIMSNGRKAMFLLPSVCHRKKARRVSMVVADGRKLSNGKTHSTMHQSFEFDALLPLAVIIIVDFIVLCHLRKTLYTWTEQN